METFLFIGTVLPDTNRISSPPVGVMLEAERDYPSGTVTIQVADNRLIASFVTAKKLTDDECATMRNVVQDIASSVCDAAAIIEGAWTIVTIDTCLYFDGSIRMRFSNASQRLKLAFQEHAVVSNDITAINQHPDGFFLRLALDDLNAGLMEGKFLRSHIYRAVESLRNSVAPANENTDRSKCWEIFRTALGIEHSHVALLTNHAERHGDYANADPMSSQEVDVALCGIADLISRYVRWFKAKKLMQDRNIGV